MPELPEVETVRAGLAALVAGATIADVEVLRDSCVRLHARRRARVCRRGSAAGRSTRSCRRGKFLWFPLASREPLLARRLTCAERAPGHVGTVSRLRGRGPRSRTRIAARGFTVSRRRGGSRSDFLDQRTFGYLHGGTVASPRRIGTPGGQGSALPGGARIGGAHRARRARPGTSPTLPPCRALRQGTRGIKQVLLDQTVVSGIGNIYADEALWAARIHPQRPAHAVTGGAGARCSWSRARGHDGVRSPKAARVSTRCTSTSTASRGTFRGTWRPMAAAGEPCDRCGGLITSDAHRRPFDALVPAVPAAISRLGPPGTRTPRTSDPPTAGTRAGDSVRKFP